MAITLIRCCDRDAERPLMTPLRLHAVNLHLSLLRFFPIHMACICLFAFLRDPPCFSTACARVSSSASLRRSHISWSLSKVSPRLKYPRTYTRYHNAIFATTDPTYELSKSQVELRSYQSSDSKQNLLSGLWEKSCIRRARDRMGIPTAINVETNKTIGWCVGWPGGNSIRNMGHSVTVFKDCQAFD